MEFFREIELSKTTSEAIARALYVIAKADGIHEREAGLIASFWIDTGHGAAALSDLERMSAITPAELAAALISDEERQLFLKTAILLAWADGKVTDAERKALDGFAAALGVDRAKLQALEASVKEFL